MQCNVQCSSIWTHLFHEMSKINEWLFIRLENCDGPCVLSKCIHTYTKTYVISKWCIWSCWWRWYEKEEEGESFKTFQMHFKISIFSRHMSALCEAKRKVKALENLDAIVTYSLLSYLFTWRLDAPAVPCTDISIGLESTQTRSYTVVVIRNMNVDDMDSECERTSRIIHIPEPNSVIEMETVRWVQLLITIILSNRIT